LRLPVTARTLGNPAATMQRHVKAADMRMFPAQVRLYAQSWEDTLYLKAVTVGRKLHLGEQEGAISCKLKSAISGM
jgi:hypothetical protein